MKFKCTSIVILIVFMTFLSAGCGSSGGGDDGGGSDNGDSTAEENGGGATASMTLGADPNSIPADGSSSTSITATLIDNAGNEVAQGTSVTFSTTLGTFSNGTTNYSATTPDDTGVVIVSLIAGTTAGPVTVTATSNAIPQTTPVTFTESGGGSNASTINVTAEFNSINPEEATEIYADVYDASGYEISGVRIMFTLNDPVLAWISNTGTTDSEGRATALLTAREIPGEVEITATTASLTNDPPKKIIILDQSAPSKINLTTTPASILVQGTSNVRAEVLDAETNPVADGTTVVFEVENELYGSITHSSTTNNGYATATFEAENQPGTTKITVSARTASNSIDIIISQAPPATIEFLSAEPQWIALQGTGGNDYSVIKFIVKDSNGTPLEGENVSFKMYGPNGGEYINPIPDDPTPDEIDVSTDSNGIAQVILHSGNVAGPVTISATIVIDASYTMTSRSSVVSIGGGVPSAKRFSVSADILNLPGLEYNNKTTDITVAMADRFGNYNVLKGTTVSFVAESGLAVDTSEITLEENGLATVSVRTQQPIDPNLKAPEDVAADGWEIDLQISVNSKYSYDTSGHPRDGLCSILVYATGEEHFDDSNANGIYDDDVDPLLRESFMDTFEDPFCDYNGNGEYDDGTHDPEELYIDFADDKMWNGKNDEWDGNKYIFGNLPILITGSPVVKFSESNFNVDNGGSQSIGVLVCDQNLNPLTPGSTVTISTDVGKLVGKTSHIYRNSSTIGPNEDGHLALIEYIFEVYDDDSDDSDPAKKGAITVAVDWEGTITTYQITGTVD